MKVTSIIIFFLLLFNSSAFSQVCGSTFLTVYLEDSKGNLIRNAKIETYQEDFRNKIFLNTNENEKYLSWSQEKQAYFGFEEFGGGYNKVGLKISASGFEDFKQIVDLPLGYTSYKITLKRLRSKEIAKSIKMMPLFIEVKDENKEIINTAEIKLFEKDKLITQKTSTLNYFDSKIDLLPGIYTLEFTNKGFRKLKIINLDTNFPNSVEKDFINLNLTMKIMGCHDCKGELLGESNEENRREIIIDYQNIIKENNK